jgi:hypothetical protein
MIEGKWASLAWDMKRRQITIHAAGNTSGDWEIYDQIAALLNNGLRTCIETFFDGWKIDWIGWTTVYTTGYGASINNRDMYNIFNHSNQNNSP